MEKTCYKRQKKLKKRRQKKKNKIKIKYIDPLKIE